MRFSLRPAPPLTGVLCRPALHWPILPDISQVYQAAAPVSISRGSRGSLDDSGHGRILADLLRGAGEDDFPTLDDIEPIGEIRNMVDVGLGNENGTAESADIGDSVKD